MEKPVPVGQFEFVEWTPDKHLPHFRFLRLPKVRSRSTACGLHFVYSAMRSKCLLSLLICAASSFASDYPGKEWSPHSRAGWSEPLLKAAHEFMADQKTQSVM